jgi:hypothetical protein
MYTVHNPEPRLSRISWQQILPAARLLYTMFPPSGTTPFTWREVTDPEGQPDPVPYGDDVAELFAATGYVLDLVEHAPPVTDIVVPVDGLDAAGEHLRVLALTQGSYAWQDPTVPAPDILGPPDTGRLPDTASWFELHREAKRPWIAAAAGILAAAGAHIVAEPGEQP